MNEQELRTLVREAISRHMSEALPTQTSVPAILVRQHVSHAIFAVPEGAEMDGPCIIEPSVMCNHCGYCKSYGH